MDEAKRVAIAKSMRTADDLFAPTIDTEVVNMTAEEELRSIEEDKAIRARMSPAGALGLPALLDERRLKYGIVDEVFHSRAVWDRVFVYQVKAPWMGKKTYIQGGLIEVPDTWNDQHTKSVPTGIIVSAGQTALDHLRAHGMDVGHLINFVHAAPYSLPIAQLSNGKEIRVRMMRTIDIVSSYDLADILRSGKSHISVDEKTQQHVFVDENGIKWLPNSSIKGD